jgi:GNAT superfamily N-acetyltransferase
LKDEPENLLTLASWHQDEWSYLNPGEDLFSRISRMQQFLNEDFIPSTFIAKDKVLLGSAAIVLQDMKTEPQLTPWLASVFIRPEFRRQGIGRQLVLHVMDTGSKSRY